MADKSKSSDPTVRTDGSAVDYPEDRGNHPPHPLSKVDYSADRVEYKDNPDKPDPTSIAQIEVERDGV